jgi:Kef-type K+ transport system membrane component KefB
VIDDVLGLVILAVVSGAIHATAAGAQLSAASVGIIAGKAFFFLLGALVIGHFIVPHFFKGAARFRTSGMLLSLSLVFCFALAWLASFVGLAPIVGAFAAGLVLDEVHFKPFEDAGETSLAELLKPLSTVLVPMFFVLMGMQVDLRTFARRDILSFAIVLTLVAIVGKQICSLGVVERGVNRLAVGLGMIPRGEVGLIFAGIGASLMLPDAAGVLSPTIKPATFGAVVVMVAVTTFVTPLALKRALARKQSTEGQSKSIK